MLNRRSTSAIADARTDDDLGRPLYGSYCFAGIPKLVRSLLVDGRPAGMPADVLGSLPQRYEHVVVILLDGFGWSFFERFGAGLPFFARSLERGVASKLTTQFPSTTAAHVTTLHTGAPVGTSGVHEWFYYEPLLDRIFAPLLHATVEAEGIVGLEPSEESLFPSHTLYEDLAERGIASTCLQSRDYAASPFSTAVCRGARVSPFKTLPEALTNLGEVLRASRQPSYSCLYVDSIDAIAHRYGPDSAQLEAEVVGIGLLLESILQPVLDGLDRSTLVLVTADHGHTAVDPARTTYLDQELPSCARWMRTTAQGQPLVPAGSSRDMFLYVEPEHLDEAAGQITQQLEGKARVLRTADMMEEGYFGPAPTERLRERLGDLVVLPHRGETVWWSEDGRFTEHKRGHHGGLSAEEMEIPLLAYAHGE